MLRQRLVPAGRPGTWRTLWGDEDAEQVGPALADLGSPSLFGGPQVLTIRHADALREPEHKRILDLLPELGAGGSLVLVSKSADQRRPLFAACMRAGAAFGFPEVERRQMGPWVVRFARERGHEIAPAAVEELVDRGGADLGALAGEIEKLSVHAGPRARLEPAHVRSIVSAARGHEVWELTDRLARADIPGAARLLRQLLAEGEPPVRLLAFLAANLRNALHVAELAEEGLRAEEIAAQLKTPQWLVDRNLARRGQAADLIRALQVLRRLDLELKSARDEQAAFEAALLEIAGISESRQPAAG